MHLIHLSIALETLVCKYMWEVQTRACLQLYDIRTGEHDDVSSNHNSSLPEVDSLLK